MTAPTISAFITAMLDADEVAARGACRPVPDPEFQDCWHQGAGMPAEVMGPMESVAGTKGPAAAAHIARHDPARVLRRIAADRAIVALEVLRACDNVPASGFISPEIAESVRSRADSPTLRHLASVWSDDPGYRAEWA